MIVPLTLRHCSLYIHLSAHVSTLVKHDWFRDVTWSWDKIWVGKWSKSWNTEYVGYGTDGTQSETRKRWEAKQMRSGKDETRSRWAENRWDVEQMIQKTDQSLNRWDVETNETWSKTNAVFRHSMAALPTLPLSYPVAAHIPIMFQKALNGLGSRAWVSPSTTIFSIDM